MTANPDSLRATHRESEILQRLGAAGSGRIQDLSRALGVSEETVRRNVRRLERRGLVTRVHGGVVLKGWVEEPSFAQRFAENPDAKGRIARHLAGMIPDGASLFLDVGSTTAYVAQALRGHRGLFVVTNSLAVAQALATINGNRVFMAGGELRSHDGGAFGAEALAFVQQFRVHYAILSVVGITAAEGFLLHDLREAEFSREIIRCAQQAIIAADATKFGRWAPIRIADPDAIGTVVTDAAPPPDIAALLAGAGVATVIAEGKAP
ncbi:MAG: DeoR/GlpR family DNA-binding transcription regulator [Thermohalobaculum sp.]|nr:DeoR/GlpR family DNA-binding transcription regulator [Thermohalobaculum sp.]